MSIATLRALICAFMKSDRPSGPEFESLALEAFRYQWAANDEYRRLVERRGIRLESVGNWEQIPAVSTMAFKHLRLACGPTRLVFRTSGTTNSGQLRGEHHLTDTMLYETALRRQFKTFVIPDLTRLRLVSLTPSPGWQPDSSLGFMMACLQRTWGTHQNDFFVKEGRLDLAGVLEALEECEHAAEPVCVAGVVFAFVHLLEALERAGRRISLPQGSRIMDTGGFKGRSRSVERADLLRGYAEFLGVPADHVVNEYGMTELGSQFYDASLLGGDPEVKLGPHWVRTQVIDPEAGEVAEFGRPGLLRHIDLANLDSVLSVETEDLGIARGGGFVLLGRAAGAEPRGCSLLLEDT